ncbi:hypothetical protein IEQ44_13710 [Nocardioides sp. Y6]|uniref:Peptidase S55 domain-containing protein n=1 Tax=Nocardioides malaquae TaxID=2773426 RepID=A0ABR9RVV6_9ACTN|nr:SpoIVB peptidase S55 domain-containing protein [Nocardioides malaquae]MBE7325704.1 hypothetical protein [Nocardioides malaquae]
MNNLHRRKRPLAALVGAGLLASGLAGVTALNQAAVSAAPAAPAGECPVAFPAAALASGDSVTGLTVARGTTPASFTGEVLGVVKDGIAAGVDMIIADLSSPDIDAAGGIWAGMSGSPVHAADGRLIGAVSYGLSWGPSKVAGITPYEHMDDLHRGQSARSNVSLRGSLAGTVAGAAGVSKDQAARGMTRLQVPMSATGIDPARIAKVADRPWIRSPRSAGAAVGSVGREAIVAGGNLGASVSSGTVTYSGVGTVTSVCQGSVVGFGHPLAYMGQTSAALHPAEAVYVQEDSANTPFKVANLGAPVGVIDNDRLAGISGVLGPVPDGTTISSTSRYGNRSFSGTSTVTVPLYAPEVVWMHNATTNDRAVDGWAKGNGLVSWTITGTDEKGAPFTLERTDRHPAGWDLASEAVGEAPDLLWQLQRLSGVEVDSVESDITLSQSTARLRVAGVEQRAKGKWVKVRGPVVAKAGKKMVLRVVLKNAKQTVRRKVSLVVPRRFKGTSTPAWVRGGRRHYGDWSNDSVAALKEYVAKSARNDQAVLVLGRGDDDRAVPEAVTPAAPSIVVGQQRIRVVIR